MSYDLDVSDYFAGAGGSSTGVIQVPGVTVRVAANHSQLAVDVHQMNHPTTDHACVDLHLEDPRYFPSTLMGWFSPECTKWSIANNKAKALSAEMGGDPSLFDDVDEALQSTEQDEATRSRLLMFDVLRFIEHHRYRIVIVENVVDIAMQTKYARAWEAWQRGLRKLGYEYRVVSLNSMHAQALGLPAPQSRDRLYVVAWPAGERPVEVERMMRPRAYCPRCDHVVESRQAWKNGRTVGRYRAQYIYRCGTCGCTVEPAWLPAAAAIDWTLPGTRIGDKPIREFRDKQGNLLGVGPLAPKTLARIAAGIARYWRPFSLEAAGNTFERHPGVRTRPIDDVLRTLHTSESKALAIPLEGRDGKHAQPAWLPGRTQTARHETALVVPSGGTWNEDARPTDDPHRAFTTTEAYGLLQPFIAELRGGSSDARSIDEPLCTVTASGNHHALVAPYYGSSDHAQPISDPIGTLTTRDRYALITRHFTPRGDAAQMTTPIWKPIRTLTTTAQQSVITPGDKAAAEAMVDDCMFRMLEPHEVAAGMAFPVDYIWAGKRRDRVKLMGNAVTPPAARDLMGAVVESLGGAA
jgi:DNA (cytosine-5)-methyltransferase 1